MLPTRIRLNTHFRRLLRTFSSDSVTARQQLEVGQAGKLVLDATSPHVSSCRVVSGWEDCTVVQVSQPSGQTAAQLTTSVEKDCGTVVVSGGSDQSVKVESFVPEKFNLDVKSYGAISAEQKMEGDASFVCTGAGHPISVDKVRGMKISLHSNGGPISVRSFLEGGLDLSTKGGSFVAKKVGGPRVDVSTSGGDIKIAALYSDKTSLKSSGGSVTLGSSHGKLSVESEGGAVSILSANGEVQVSSKGGKVNVHLNEARPEAQLSFDSGDGELHFSLSDSAPAELVVKSSSIDLTNVPAQVVEGDASKGFVRVLHIPSTASKNSRSLPPRVVTEQKEGKDAGKYGTIHLNSRSVVRVRTMSWMEVMKANMQKQKELDAAPSTNSQ